MCAKSTSMQVRGKLYTACVRSCMIYGSETWALSVENQRRLERTEMQMLRRICGVTLRDKFRNETIRKRLGVECVTEVVRRGRLRWFGHVERKDEIDWVRKCRTMEIDGKRPRGRPKITWMEVATKDLTRLKLRPADAQDRTLWRRITSGGGQANLG